MSTPFHDLADQYDALTASLRELGDQWGVGQLSVGEPPAEEPAAAPSKSSDTPKK